MRTRNRLTQLLNIRHTLAAHPALRDLSYGELREYLVKHNEVMSGVKASRYAAMIRSYVRGSTIDEDACWHK